MVRLLSALLFIIAAGPATGEALHSYYTTISRADREGADGVPLRDFGLMLQRDRENFHADGPRDPGDGDDPIFGEAANRAAIPQLFATGHGNDGYWIGVAAGNFDMYVFVQICAEQNRITHLRVDPGNNRDYGSCRLR